MKIQPVNLEQMFPIRNDVLTQLILDAQNICVKISPQQNSKTFARVLKLLRKILKRDCVVLVYSVKESIRRYSQNVVALAHEIEEASRFESISNRKSCLCFQDGFFVFNSRPR